MSYMVMECHSGYAILLDEEGRFLKAANLRYEVGQTVYNPVFMGERALRVQHITRWITGGVAALAACLLLMVGIGYYQDYLVPYSSIYLSINPAVQMELSRRGTVVSLSGANKDGITLLNGYNGKGKDKVTVADELIDRAIEMGFLSEGGQVSFSIDAPDDALFQEYGIELRSRITEHLDGRMKITIEITDYHARVNPTPSPSPSPSPSSKPTESSKADLPAAVPPVTSNGNGSSDTDYRDTDYGPYNDGDTDYTPPVSDDDDSGYTNGNTDYGPQNDRDDDFDDDSDSDDSDDEFDDDSNNEDDDDDDDDE